MTSAVRIMCATDLSAPAAWAEERAARLVERAGGSLVLLHVVSALPMHLLRRAAAGVSATQLEQTARAELEGSARGLPGAAGIDVRVETATGSPASEILRLARSSRPDLLVVGAHGGHFVHELLFGSTAERLLYRTPVPLLVVKRPPRSDYRTGLAATDFSAASSAAVRTAHILLPALELTLYHAVEAQDESFAFIAGLDEAGRAEIRAQAMVSARAELDRFAQDCSARQLDKVVEYGYPMAMIEAAVQRNAADLLVLGKRGRSALEQWVVGSVTAHLARSVACDVLIVPPQEEPPTEQPLAAAE